MILWRISNFATLDGAGAKLNPARWNSFGNAVVYAADHAASALLEMLAILPEVFNVLINPLHADAKFLKILSLHLVPLDAWLR